jgi:lactoylglutathione lyase
MDRETTITGLRAELFVTDVGRSAAFYMAVLGFKVIRAGPGGYTSIGLEGATLGLNAMGNLPTNHPIQPKSGERVGLGVEIVLMVDDVATAHAQAVASDRTSVSPLITQPWGLRDFRLQDPDGYYVRVTGLSEPH